MNQRRPRPLVVFDGDDTLWQTQHLYSEAKEVLYLILAQRGVESSLAEQRLEAIELHRLKTLRFSPRRFPGSLVACYREMLAMKSIPTRASEVRAIAHAARAVFSSPVKVSASAAPVLRNLRPRYRLALLTKGDKSTQQRRIRQSKLRSLLDTVRVVPEKTEGAFASLLAAEHCPVHSAWSIGNSVRSDINPSLSLGMSAIWLQVPTWVHEDAEPLGSERLYVVHQLKDVLELLL